MWRELFFCPDTDKKAPAREGGSFRFAVTQYWNLSQSISGSFSVHCSMSPIQL